MIVVHFLERGLLRAVRNRVFNNTSRLALLHLYYSLNKFA